MTTNDPSGFKATGATVFSTVKLFACIRKRFRTQKPLNKIYIPKGYDTGYNKYLLNPDDHYKSGRGAVLPMRLQRPMAIKDTKEAKKKTA